MENRNEEEENKDQQTEKVNECPRLVNVIHIYIYIYIYTISKHYLDTQYVDIVAQISRP